MPELLHTPGKEVEYDRPMANVVEDPAQKSETPPPFNPTANPLGQGEEGPPSKDGKQGAEAQSAFGDAEDLIAPTEFQLFGDKWATPMPATSGWGKLEFELKGAMMSNRKKNEPNQTEVGKLELLKKQVDLTQVKKDFNSRFSTKIMSWDLLKEPAPDLGPYITTKMSTGNVSLDMSGISLGVFTWEMEFTANKENFEKAMAEGEWVAGLLAGLGPTLPTYFEGGGELKITGSIGVTIDPKELQLLRKMDKLGKDLEKLNEEADELGKKISKGEGKLKDMEEELEERLEKRLKKKGKAVSQYSDKVKEMLRKGELSEEVMEDWGWNKKERELAKKIMRQVEKVQKWKGKLGTITRKADKIVRKFESVAGKVTSRVGKMIAKVVGKRVMKAVFKLIPIIGWISTILDIASIIKHWENSSLNGTDDAAVWDESSKDGSEGGEKGKVDSNSEEKGDGKVDNGQTGNQEDKSGGEKVEDGNGGGGKEGAKEKTPAPGDLQKRYKDLGGTQVSQQSWDMLEEAPNSAQLFRKLNLADGGLPVDDAFVQQFVALTRDLTEEQLAQIQAKAGSMDGMTLDQMLKGLQRLAEGKEAKPNSEQVQQGQKVSNGPKPEKQEDRPVELKGRSSASPHPSRGKVDSHSVSAGFSVTGGTLLPEVGSQGTVEMIVSLNGEDKEVHYFKIPNIYVRLVESLIEGGEKFFILETLTDYHVVIGNPNPHNFDIKKGKRIRVAEQFFNSK